MAKKRLDQLLVDRGLVETKSKAQRVVMSGVVLVDDQPQTKPGSSFNESVAIRLKKPASDFVGRGGEKLQGALDELGISVAGATVIDVGASTGGFTECVLRNGAKKVIAVDVGTNQLDYSLRINPLVSVFENTHILKLTADDLVDKPTFATIDVSFIGLRKILPHITTLLSENAQIIALIKPQFELGPEYVKKGGVVSSEKDQQLAVSLVSKSLEELGCTIKGVSKSKLTGAKSGNQEYFLWCECL